MTKVPREADALLARLALDGVTVPAPGRGCMDLNLSRDERQQAEDWWGRNGGRHKAAQGWVAVCPGAKWPSKRWPWEGYVEVGCRLLKDHALLPVVIGGKEDCAIGQRLLAAWGAGLCAAGDLSVRESAALMEDALLYLGNDTGAMHLAAAVGTPCVAVFSAQDWPGKWEPYGSGHQVLRWDVPCAGCKQEVCGRGLECLREIRAAQVYEACLRVLQRQVVTPPRDCR